MGLFFIGQNTFKGLLTLLLANANVLLSICLSQHRDESLQVAKSLVTLLNIHEFLSGSFVL